jgi:hypothetical protein
METHTQTSTDAVVYAAASALGIIAGMRAMTAPALVSYMAQQGCLQVDRQRFGFFGHPRAFKILAGLASGEIIFDKLPFMPKRTDSAGRTLRGDRLPGQRQVNAYWRYCGHIRCDWVHLRGFQHPALAVARASHPRSRHCLARGCYCHLGRPGDLRGIAAQVEPENLSDFLPGFVL